MSDDEEQYNYDDQEDEEVEAEEAEEAPRRSNRPPSRPRSPAPDEGGKGKSEGELAMLAQKRKQEDEDDAKLAQYEEQRRIQREKEEEELRLLKEKLERRKAEREEEERLLAERRQEEEERRRLEDEGRKAKLEEIKRKKEEEKRKRLDVLSLVGNVEIPEKKDKNQDKFDKFGNIVKAKAEMGLTKEQHLEQKRRHLAEINKPIEFAEFDLQSLKAKVKDLHQRLSRLEGDRYDLEERRTRQEYDLKELNERQRQIARQNAVKKGLNPDQIETGPHPAKVPLINKYDRQIDRRSFNERRALYALTSAVPHFPNVAPMPQELVKEIRGEKTRKGDADEDGAYDDEEGIEEEEEE